MASVTLSAPAKVNLSLRILGKRSDGYHELETLMAPLTLADELEINHLHGGTKGDVQLICNDPTLPTNADNLCVRAAHIFQKASGINEPIAVTLLKRIPHGAGLGGGSSDAAAVLRGMNTLFNEPFVNEELEQMATTLGSDVPFFIKAQFSWWHGRGELRSEKKVPILPPWRLLLIKPPFSISTPWAYSMLKSGLGEGLQESKTSLEDAISLDGISIFNDLESPVFKKYLLLPILKAWLQKRLEVRAAWMSGSGSTMIALLHDATNQAEPGALKTAIATEFGETFWMKETEIDRVRFVDDF